MAKILLKSGVDIKIIYESSGFTIEDINNLKEYNFKIKKIKFLNIFLFYHHIC